MFVLGQFISCTYSMPMMYFILLLYHAWPIPRGCLAFELSTRPPDPISLLASLLHGSLVIITFICVFLHVFDTNTSAGIYLAVWPISSYGLSPTSSKEECVQTVRSTIFAW